MKHLLKLLDVSEKEILEILNLADQLKYERKHGIPHRHLEGKSLGMIFQKSSTRTRLSFETGMYQLGGQALFLSNRDLQIGRGEPVQDTARVMSRYLDGIMIRTFAQQEVEDLAKYGTIPVINNALHRCKVIIFLPTVLAGSNYNLCICITLALSSVFRSIGIIYGMWIRRNQHDIHITYPQFISISVIQPIDLTDFYRSR